MTFDGHGLITVDFRAWQFDVAAHGGGIGYAGAWDEPPSADIDVEEITNPETGQPVSARLSAYVRRYYQDECERAIWESAQ